MVLTCHYSYFFPSYQYIIKFLWTGVFLFFVISGYVFGGLILYKTENWISYTVKRFFRIYPLYIVSVLSYYFFTPGDENKIVYFLKHIFFLHTTSSVKEAFYFNPAFWSLPVEVEFYMLIPFLILLRKKIGIKAIYICFILSLAAKFFIALYADGSTVDALSLMSVHIIAMFPEFCMGILLYQLSQLKKIDGSSCLIFSFTAGSAILGACTYFFAVYGDAGISGHIVMRAYFSTFCSLGYALLIFPILKIKNFNKYCVSICFNIGTSSYGLYLFHNLIPKIFEKIHFFPSGITGYTLASLCTLLLALFLNLYIEIPFRNYGRNFACKIHRKFQASLNP